MSFIVASKPSLISGLAFLIDFICFRSPTVKVAMPLPENSSSILNIQLSIAKLFAIKTVESLQIPSHHIFHMRQGELEYH